MDSLSKKKTSVMHCSMCHVRYSQIRRSATRLPYCKECFYDAFEMDVHTTIMEQKLFKPGDRVAIAISGGKDSTVLAHVMRRLNDKYHYELDMFLLAVDEGISGYRDDSLETVKRNEKQFNIPLKIVSYEQLYGWRMDQVVATVGKKNNCTFCGVFRRQALDRGAAQLGATKLCTGHNADDAAETVFMNILRGDIARIGRSPTTMTGHENQFSLPRCKPLMFIYEKEIVLYAHFKKLDYFSTECTYAPNAYRGYTRDLVKHLEASNSQTILQILSSMSQLRYDTSSISPTPPGRCERCQWISSNTLCKCCVLLEALNSQNPQIALVNKGRREKLIKHQRSKHLCLSFACDTGVTDKEILINRTCVPQKTSSTCTTCSCHKTKNTTRN